MTQEQFALVQTLLPSDPSWGGTGALLLPPDPRDYDIRSLPGVREVLEAGVPDSVDLTGLVKGAILDQGSTGACVAYSTSHVAAMDDVLETGQWATINAAEVYRRAGGTGANGVDSRLVLSQAVEQGMPLVSGGAVKTIAAYAFVPQQEGLFTQTIKAALAAGYPMVLALLLPTDWGWRSGHGGKTSAYHQVALAGFTPDGYWIFVNSWGPQWFPSGSPRAGVGSILESYIEADGLQARYAFAYTVTPLNITPPPPPPVVKTGTLSGKVTGEGIGALAAGQVYSLSSNAVLTLSSVTIDGTPGPTPGTLSVTDYSPNPVPTGHSFLINGKGFQGGNATVSWGGQPLSAYRLSDSQMQAVSPPVTTPQSRVVTVRVEGATANGPLLMVTTDDQPPPGGLTLKLFPRRRSATTVTLLAYCYNSNGNPERATLTGSIGNVILDTWQAQIGSWTVTGLPQGQQQITVNASSTNGSGTATAVI